MGNPKLPIYHWTRITGVTTPDKSEDTEPGIQGIEPRQPQLRLASLTN